MDIKLRYLEMTAIGGAFLFAEPRDKKHALEMLGIEARKGETPFVAWLRALAEENGLVHTKPADRNLVEAILGDAEAMKFFWFLA